MGFPVQVKWGKQVLVVEMEERSTVDAFQKELMAQTGVPVERQTILAKSKGLWKGALKHTSSSTAATIDWKKAHAVKSPLSVLLMGSADAIVQKPASKTVFVEDLPPEQVAVLQEPAGLVNLGNTCYMNSVVQCLRAVPAFQESLTGTTASTALATSLAQTYQTLNTQPSAVPPVALVQAVKQAFPQFAQRSPSGHPMQQDAEEFYSSLLTQLPGVDELFGLRLVETLTCQETSETTETSDWHRRLTCNIQGGVSAVNHINEGIALSLSGTSTKHSDQLGRDAIWTRSQRLATLPPVLTIQFGRFYWKATPDSEDHAGVKCKVMKPVAFGSTLDVLDFCSSKVKAVLQRARVAAAAVEEESVQRKLEGKDADGDDAMQEETNPEELHAALAMSLQETDDNNDTEEANPISDLPPHFLGHYELFAVVTHKGRDADGGHYMAWVKAEHQSDNPPKNAENLVNEDWFVFDDDEVSPCLTEDVLKLKGGGDWHMSYLNFYRIPKKRS